jgi:hypothetical protein
MAAPMSSRSASPTIDSLNSRVAFVERTLRRDGPGERGKRLDPGTAIIRSLVCRLRARGPLTETSPEEIAEQIYPGQPDVARALTDLPNLIQRAAVAPAMTTVAGWAAELLGTQNYAGALPLLAPRAAYSSLAARGLRLEFGDGIGIIRVPVRLASPLIGGDFVGESQPIPVRRLGLSATPVGPPKKLAVISHFSAELRDRSVPTIESVLRQAIADDTSQTLDARLLDDAAGTATRPAGLLNGVTPITPTSGGAGAALAGDLGALAAAIPAASDLVYVMNPADRVRALTLAPGLSGVAIIDAPTLTAKTVIALDAADFASGEGDAPRFDLSEQATLHESDTPEPIGTPGSPNVVAAPSTSLWQQDLVFAAHDRPRRVENAAHRASCLRGKRDMVTNMLDARARDLLIAAGLGHVIARLDRIVAEHHFDPTRQQRIALDLIAVEAETEWLDGAPNGADRHIVH